ncbi:DUF4870 domain-containing protein [Rhodopirellula baltica]|uniref:DUF4870 domain-containing protein n=2 Tax=Rhodopirellula baltica TaxID=265606 RepID=F2AK50_RHOBT|nr:DUF4870 domain-containing protein [Rhodopirellula baltica]EGF29918.1 conserved hypothetical protein, membrane [Rhodopirellula baltica WH47]ELP29654.1 hypothetical protein RBSWK_06510 [Rhodopirellula baltica SWK14]
MQNEPDSNANTWAMILHFSQFAGYVVPIAGFLAPIVIWQLKKEDIPSLDLHGRNVTNWLITQFLLSVLCWILLFVGIGVLGFLILAVLSVIFPIIGGIKASQGEVWKYPMTIRFV